jgi:hypothetical protein
MPPDNCEDIVIPAQIGQARAIYMDERTTIQDISPSCSHIAADCRIWAAWQDGNTRYQVPTSATYWGAIWSRYNDDPPPSGDIAFMAGRFSYEDTDNLEAVVRVCRSDDIPTSTPTKTVQTTATPSRTAFTLPTITTTSVVTGTVVSDQCVEPVEPTQRATLGAIPDLDIVLPTMEPVQWITATVEINVDEVTSTVSETHQLLRTPLALMHTATYSYTWEGGRDLAAEWQDDIEPGLSWLAVANPTHPGYSLEGSVLWALAPVLTRLSPILIVLIIVVFFRFFLWIINWLRRLIELVFKIIELIPGE